eukprot:PhF_6_TR25248/c0_g1_i1/m.34763
MNPLRLSDLPDDIRNELWTSLCTAPSQFLTYTFCTNHDVLVDGSIPTQHLSAPKKLREYTLTNSRRQTPAPTPHPPTTTLANIPPPLPPETKSFLWTHKMIEEILSARARRVLVAGGSSQLPLEPFASWYLQSRHGIRSKLKSTNQRDLNKAIQSYSEERIVQLFQKLCCVNSKELETTLGIYSALMPYSSLEVLAGRVFRVIPVGSVLVASRSAVPIYWQTNCPRLRKALKDYCALGEQVLKGHVDFYGLLEVLTSITLPTSSVVDTPVGKCTTTNTTAASDVILPDLDLSPINNVSHIISPNNRTYDENTITHPRILQTTMEVRDGIGISTPTTPVIESEGVPPPPDELDTSNVTTTTNRYIFGEIIRETQHQPVTSSSILHFDTPCPVRPQHQPVAPSTHVTVKTEVSIPPSPHREEEYDDDKTLSPPVSEHVERSRSAAPVGLLPINPQSNEEMSPILNVVEHDYEYSSQGRQEQDIPQEDVQNELAGGVLEVPSSSSSFMIPRYQSPIASDEEESVPAELQREGGLTKRTQLDEPQKMRACEDNVYEHETL